MTSKTPVRFGLLGAGAIAQSYSEAFRRTDRAVLSAVIDVREEVAAATAGPHGCPHFRSHHDLLAANLVDAVIVCTPPATHADLCVDCLEHGLHVLCEKPLALDVASANRMLDAASRAGRRFTMASKFRYAPDVIRAKSLVAGGLLGELRLFENTFSGRVDMRSRWNSRPEISGGGVLIDNGTHSVDIARYFLGPLAAVQVVEGPRIQPLAVEDSVSIFVRSHTGVMAHIDLTWSLAKESPYYIRIYGDQGTLLVGWKEAKYRRAVDSDWNVFGSGYDKHQAFTNQLNNFVSAIRDEEELLITAADALASVQVIDLAYRSMRQHTWINIINTEL